MVLENSTVMLLVYTWAGYSQTLGMGKIKTLILKIVDNVFVTITVCADSYYECFYWSELQYRIQAHRKMGDRFFGHL